MPGRRYLIVHHATIGNAHDAEVLAAALARVAPGAEIATASLPAWFNRDYRADAHDLVPAARGGWDALFLLETARLNRPLFDPGFARRYVYVPYVEWLNEDDEAVLALGLIDTVIYKNEFTRSRLEALPCMARVPVRAVTGWTSRDPGLPANPWEEVRFDRFLHARGVSHMKQTDVVVEAWQRHPEWPPLTVTAYVRDPLSFAAPLKIAPNITVVLRRQSEAEMKATIETHGVHVMPSLAESFGHALNEARAAGALLVTTGAPPMSDLVVSGESGMLVAADPANAVPHFRSTAFPVTVEAVEEAVEAVVTLPLKARVGMGRAARAAYERGRDDFHRAIAALEL